jgi:hypothetical protein
VAGNTTSLGVADILRERVYLGAVAGSKNHGRWAFRCMGRRELDERFGWRMSARPTGE